MLDKPTRRLSTWRPPSLTVAIRLSVNSASNPRKSIPRGGQSCGLDRMFEVNGGGGATFGREDEARAACEIALSLIVAKQPPVRRSGTILVVNGAEAGTAKPPKI